MKRDIFLMILNSKKHEGQIPKWNLPFSFKSLFFYKAQKLKELKELSLPTVAEELRQQSFWRSFKQQDICLNSLTSLTL